MGLTKALKEVAASQSLCTKLNCGGVANRLKIKIGHNNVVESFFAAKLIGNSSFEGRCSWGTGGFDFKVSILSSSPYIGFSATANIKSSISQEQMDEALEQFFVRLCKNLTHKNDRQQGKIRGGGKYKSPQLEARKKGPYLQNTTANRVNHWISQGVFDQEFGKFLVTNVHEGFRCKGT